VPESTAGFRGLIARQKAQALALAVIATVKGRPADEIANVIRAQLVRAAGSIPANIAEGYGRYSAGAYRNHLSIARGSLFEVETWIDLMHDSGYLTDAKNRELIEQCGEVGRLIDRPDEGFTAVLSASSRRRDSRI
jgi:four helix bundle protein